MEVDFSNKNILIVDDSKTIIFLLQSLLEEEGYTSIVTAMSAYEAYEVLKQNSIDIILLDVVMPDINGIEACRYIKSNPLYKHIPIIMVTADNTDETLKKSFSAGASDYINKPINVTNMKVRIESVLMSIHKDTLILNQNRLLAVNETVYMLSHQWRQPLASISVTSMDISISYQLGEMTEESLNESLELIDSAVQSLSTTLDEFSNISQIESKPTIHNINDTVTKSINFIKGRFATNNISINSHLSKQNDISYFPNEIIKILVNIYTNTLEAFARNSIKKQKYIKISTKQTDSITSIIISDNAGGVEESMINKVFEPYASIKPEKNAVGLGLYNAYSVLKKFMNANISLSSIDDSTTVTIELPTV